MVLRILHGFWMSFADPPLIIGHRGAAGLCPENTVASFQRAVELGVDAVELDVHLCENELCVIHDATLERTSNGEGAVANYSLTELRKLDAGQGEKIPLLREVFLLLPDHVGINVELKGAGTAEALADFMTGYADRDVLVSSFDHALLEKFQKLSPLVPVAPLFSKWRNNPADAAKKLQSRFVNLSRKIVTPQRCREITAEALGILVYTVNNPEEARALFEMGVSGVFTDYPDRLMQCVPTDRDPAGADTSRR
jgi:glycerophosphoryl diester phosphodiesterase